MITDVIQNMQKCFYNEQLKKVVYLLLFFINFGYSYNVTDSILSKIRSHHFKEVNKLLLKHNKNELLVKELSFYNQLISNYGIYKDSINIKYTNENYKKNTLIKSLNKLNIGLYKILYEYGEDANAFKELNESLDIALALKNKPLICEISKTILIYYDRLFSLSDNSYKHYLKIYENHVYDTLENQIFSLTKITLKMYHSNYNLNEKDVNQLKLNIGRIKHKYYKAKTLLSLAIYYENKEKAYKKSSKGYLEAYQLFTNNTNGIYIERAYATKINSGISLNKSGNPKEAIKLLKKLNTIYKGKTIEWIENFKHICLSEAYDKIGNSKSAHFHLNESRKIRNRFNQKRHDEFVTNEKQKHVVQQKSNKIASLKTKMNTILPILAIITLLLGIVFILYKKYYKKTEVLEEEKSEVVKKIDKLTEIVIKNHIVLKDKTKVYVADLMYIKSDDHFLRVFLSNGKNHFVRGKLYKMVEELPPNFIRCHRSYIINRNFIKQVNNTHIILVDKTEIPLARTYKDKF